MTSPFVRRRKVFFLAGFDPKGASYYHRLYQAEAPHQAAVTDARYNVGPRQKLQHGGSSWKVTGDVEGLTTETVYEYAQWDDIVRLHWARHPGAVLRDGLRGYFAVAAMKGRLVDVWRVAPRTLLALVYPVLYWLAASLLACAVATVAVIAVGHFSRWIVALIAGACMLWMAVILERRFNTSWLLRIYSFAAVLARRAEPAMEPRLCELAARIAESLEDTETDEVLLVGFSVGSILAVSVAARLQRHPGFDRASKFTVLTLGHCIPLLGLMPQAHHYRAELRQITSVPHVSWVDVSSPLDWGSFALVDPVKLCVGDDAARLRFSPVMLSPRFHTMFAKERFRTLRRDKRRMHMQYLMAGDLQTTYDYFAITAGPIRLACRLLDGQP